MIYRYFCFLGEFRIHQDSADSWHLCLSGHRIRVYASAEEAVQAVRDHKTGFRIWDLIRAYDIPGIDAWEKAECPCEGDCVSERRGVTCLTPAPLTRP